MMQAATQMKTELKQPYRTVCRTMGLPYSTFQRWKQREGEGAVLAKKPGPVKTEPLAVASLTADIRALAHGEKRTQGTGALQQKYEHQISRRDFQALVEATRRELRKEKEVLERRIDWQVPGWVWSMDDMECGGGHTHVVHDLGSRYTLKAGASDTLALGKTVAAGLEGLFIQHGAPLFLKRDNGSNLNHSVVNEVLAAFGVIPLNSPPYYSPYNGGVEKKNQELQRHVDVWLGNEKPESRVLELMMELSGHELNHKVRTSLGGATPCAMLHRAPPGLNRRQRQEAFDQIRAMAVDIVRDLGERTNAASETAFRHAAETWMQQNSIIRVTRNGEVLPCFYRFQSHYL